MPSVSLLYLLTGIGASVIIVWKGILPAWRALRSGMSRASGALDNIGGRDPFVDPATGKLVPGIPAIGERFTAIEAKLDGLANTSQRLDAIDTRLGHVEGRIEAVEGRVGDHEVALGLIAGSHFEKGAEATLAAIREKSKDIIDGEATES